MNATNQSRELTIDEVDIVSGADTRLYDFKLFGIRFLGGITDSGYAYSCVFTPDGQGGCR